MEKEQIIEGNKLIAEFMQCELNSEGKYYIDGKEKAEADVSVMYWNSYYAPEELRYYGSWDWLMPVVEKIITENTSTVQLFAPGYLSGPKSKLFGCDLLPDQRNATQNESKSLAEAVYLSVIEFIEWYNKEKINH